MTDIEFAELTDPEQKKVIDRLLNTDICVFYQDVIPEPLDMEDGWKSPRDGCRLSKNMKCPWRNPDHYRSCGRWQAYQLSIRDGKRCFKRYRLIRLNEG
jgi:hypothetical protein